MPLLLSKQINPYSAYAVWHITETEAQLLEKIKETPAHTNPNKKSEWIVTRILINYLCSIFNIQYAGVERLSSGKPFLTGHNAEISISHSFPVAACLINTRKSCGIDIELPRKQLLKVRKKFLHSSDVQSDDIQHLCKIWAAKEALYKVHGDKNLSLKDEMIIAFETENRANGIILKKDFESTYAIEIESLFNYIMAYTI